MGDTDLKVGDTLVQFGQVFQIFKIKEEKTASSVQKLIFFKPLFASQENETLICSIPADSLIKTKIRRPVKKERLQKLFKKLFKRPPEGEPLNLLDAKQNLESNRLSKVAAVLRSFWFEKNGQSKNFTLSREGVLRESLKVFSEEAACVLGTDPDQVRKEIKLNFKKALEVVSG